MEASIIERVAKQIALAGIRVTVEHPGFINIPANHPGQWWEIGTVNPTWGADLLGPDYVLIRNHDLGVPSDHQDEREIAAAIFRMFAVDSLRHEPIAQCLPIPVPMEVLDAVALAEAKRMAGGNWTSWSAERQAEETRQEREMMTEHAVYFPSYSTDSPGYVGPVVIVLWSGDPGAIASFTLSRSGQWEFCNQTVW